jgi:CDP-diacylglycerol---serine O-phosphatidyltransferase
MPMPLPSSTDSNADNPLSIEQASRIYFLPNLMTAGNLFCGFAACLRCIEANFITREAADLVTLIPPEAITHYREAVWYIFGAMAFDALDGRLARMGGRESLFGAEFDSLADIVSFGLAPALMVFFLIVRPAGGDQTLLSAGGLIGFIYLLCAAMRLARFNVITHPLLQRPDNKPSNKDFVGLPVPAAAGTVGALMLFLLNLISHDKSLQSMTLGLPLLLLLVAVLMISTVRYPSGKHIDFRTKTKFTTLIIYIAVAAGVVIFKEYGMFFVCLGYIFYGLLRHWRKHGLMNHAPLV